MLHKSDYQLICTGLNLFV